VAADNCDYKPQTFPEPELKKKLFFFSRYPRVRASADFSAFGKLVQLLLATDYRVTRNLLVI
jgi:hypothetical protein